MTDTSSHRVLSGSDRAPVPGAEVLGPVDPGERIEATLVLRRRAELPEEPGVLSREELAQQYGADPADVDAVRSALEAAGVEVLDVDPASRRVRIAGPASVLTSLFATDLTRVRTTDPSTGHERQIRQREGTLSIPDELHGRVTAVLGLDNRPQARTRLQAVAHAAVTTSYTPLQLGEIYKLPAGTDGSGQTIAIIELGGGFGPDDLDTYFKGLGITGPTVTAVSVDGAVNEPGKDPSGADGEVLLDIEVVGALAPKADVLVYFAPNSDAGFVDAVSAAAHATPTPASMSISWGQSEDDWTAQARAAMDSAFADAVALGVTVTAAAGDDGSTDRATDGKAHCDFPASSPHVLACGGTSLQADPGTGTVTSETVWNNGAGNGATGGGISDAFGLPSWQKHAGVPKSVKGKVGRGVPDVAGDADPRTGYQVLVDGKAMVIGGTSAVAPLWAALVARLVQALGKPVGLLQPAIYAAAAAGKAAPGFRDITSGNNGSYKAKKGWDPCTGLGVPDGAALLSVLQGSASSA